MVRSGRLLALAILVLPVSAPLAAAEKPDVRAKLTTLGPAAGGSKALLVVELTVGAGWHVNSHTPSEPWLIPTNVTLAASGGTLSPVRYPGDVARRFEFSEKPLRVYEGTVRFEADLDLPAKNGAFRVTAEIAYQACNERQCFAPAKIPLSATIIRSAS
jgi:hypothetical protein